MANQLTTALVSTGCFKVVDRQNLKGVMDELGLQQSGAVDRRTASKVGKLVGADIIVTAAVTAIHKMIPQGYYRHSVGRFGKAPQAIGTGTAGASGANNVVTKAQRTLKALGLYDGAVDGLAGPRTERAIRAFQEQVGIDPTGKLDVRTMKELDGMSQ